MALGLKAGDEVINTNQEHGGGYGAWKSLSKRYGLAYKQAIMPLPANGSRPACETSGIGSNWSALGVEIFPR